MASEVSGQDLGWFFDQVYRRADVFDYAVQELTSNEKKVRGLVDRDGKRVAVGGESMGSLYETTVVLRREGEAVFPVPLLVRFADGSVAREKWDGAGRWKMFRFERAARAVSAEVDPERVLLLDLNVTNNSRTLEPQAEAAATKWSLQWLVWLQDVLLTYGFFV